MRSTGQFRSSPTVNGSHTRRDGGSTWWWLIIDADPELGRYLRRLFTLDRWRVSEPQDPLWGTHISVVRGEPPPKPAAWARLDGTEVEFEFEPDARLMDDYLWVPVTCPIALDHREELGLPREPIPALHLTFGNLKHEAC